MKPVLAFVIPLLYALYMDLVLGRPERQVTWETVALVCVIMLVPWRRFGVWLLGVLLPFLALGAITNVSVETTHNQAIVRYTSPDTTACTLEVSKDATYSPLVNDVNTGLFAGSNLDSRAGNLTAGRQRTFIVGQQKVETSSASVEVYSRAIQTDTLHYFRVTCGADQATGSFRTTNIPAGLTRARSGYQTDPNKPDELLWPTVKYGREIIDPWTGVLHKVVAKPNWGYNSMTPSTGTAFAAASGTNWTNPGNALADDAAYATYTGTGQDWLFLGTNGAYPTDSTFGQGELSFINILVKGSISGDLNLELCITRDGVNRVCEVPIIPFTLSGTESTITICANAPCSVPNNPGDIMTTLPIPYSADAFGTGRVYNTSADYTKISFTETADCNKLVDGETITINRSGTSYSITLGARNCGASPAESTITVSTQFDQNGTSGFPLFYNDGIKGNRRFGVLLRKANTNSSTISLNYAYYKLAESIVRFGFGSGGMVKICSSIPTSNGFYHCGTGGGGRVFAIRPEANGDVTVRFIGYSIFSIGAGQGIDPKTYYCDPRWDDTNANVFYCPMDKSGGEWTKRLLVKFVYDGNDLECGESGAGCTASDPWTNPRPILHYSSYTNLTSPSIPDNLVTFTAGRSFPFVPSSFGCSFEAQGAYAQGYCRAGNQDSLAWHYVLRLSDGAVVAAADSFNIPYFAWCGDHTYQNNRYGLSSTPEWNISSHLRFQVSLNQSLSACTRGSTCSTCPSVTVTDINYTGQNWCSTINVTSAWDGSWGSTPPDFLAGDPLNTYVPEQAPGRWLRHPLVADHFLVDSENIKILQKNTNSQWVIERGAKTTPGVGNTTPAAHALNAPMYTTCPSGAGIWYFLDSPDGTDPSSFFNARFANHASANGINVGLHPDYRVWRGDFANKSEMKNNPMTSLPVATTFAGKPVFAGGNAIEKHPAPPDNAGATFVDLHPYLFGSSVRTKVNVTGYLYKATQYWTSMDYKYAPWLVTSGHAIFQDMSGPSASITGGVADRFKYCVTHRAGECYAGSVVGDFYFSAPLDSTVDCITGESVAFGPRDFCAVNMHAMTNVIAQWGIPPAGNVAQNGSTMRVVTREFHGWSSYNPEFRVKGGGTANTKILPDYSWIVPYRQWLIKLPPYPPADNINRAEFVKTPVQLKPPTGLGVDNSIIEFGYDTNFYCTTRAEACVKENSSTQPFMFAGDTLTGVPCSTGCTINVPGVSGRVLYYRWKYLASGGAVLGVSQTQVTAVP